MKDSSAVRLCIVTTTRADWGLLLPVARELSKRDDVKIDVVAGNMHLLERYGHTIDEITASGFDVAGRIPCDVDGDSDASRVLAMAKAMQGAAEVFDRLRPDAVLLLGDRYEMLAIASAAATMHLPIIHIAGGEISEGALDDSYRHAITKLSTLHLTATEEYRRRVIQLGEDPSRVVNTGAIGVWNAFNIPLLSADELGTWLGIDFDGRKVASVTFHPATNDSASPREQVKALTSALAQFPDMIQVISYPNNDAGGESIIPVLEEYAAAHPGNVRAVSSLGMVRYQSLLHIANVVIGNSSSGIVEAPSAGAVTVDVGVRQKGRMAADSIIHCEPTESAIREAIDKALSPEYQQLAAKKENPYYKPDTLRLMTEAITDFLHSLPVPSKKFYDLC